MRCAWKVNGHEGFFLRIRQPLPWGAFRLWGPFGIPSIFIPRDPKNGIDLGWGPGPGFSSPRQDAPTNVQHSRKIAQESPQIKSRMDHQWTSECPWGLGLEAPCGPQKHKNLGMTAEGSPRNMNLPVVMSKTRRPKISKASKRHIKGIRSLQNLLQAL